MNMLNEPGMASETTSPSSLLTDLSLLAGAPNGIQKLRELILELAVRGKLVPQDPNDKSADFWVNQIENEKAKLVEAGLLRETKSPSKVHSREYLTVLPESWQWVTLTEIILGMDSGWSPACEATSSPNDEVWGVLKTTSVQMFKYLQGEIKSYLLT
ncbi:hypothetical protein ACFQDN_23680 [Pseudomonas asuensis]